MPQTTLRLQIDGREETLTEYICDWPDCPHTGIQVFALAALRIRAVVCAEHAARIANHRNDGARRSQRR